MPYLTDDQDSLAPHAHAYHHQETPIEQTANSRAMPFFYSKNVGGRHFGTSVHASRHGVHRGPWRFSFGRFNCFKAH